MLWAVALGVWWSRLQGTPILTHLQPTPAATAAARLTPQPGEAAQPIPESTPVTVPVVREAKQVVRDEDWITLARSFRVEHALSDIAELISPKYAGRAVGSPGGKLASEWIAARFAEYGLQPAGDNGTYFQEFPVPYAELTAMPTFQIVDERGQVVAEYHLRDDYTIWLGGYADGGQAEGPVIWVSDGRHEDYNGLNAEGAIVLCRYRYPVDDVLRQALEHGAKAVLLARPESTSFPMRRQAHQGPLLPQGIPTLIVGQRVLQGLLADSGMTLEDLTIQYQWRPLSTRVRLNVPLRYEKTATGRNVLGVLPGSDPDGTQQVFIIGAHYDHLGADPDGTVWGGANDNASGVAVLLEIARLWQEVGYVPQRTVLFAAWDGEEIGLYGSNYYVEHPRYPLKNTVGMLQLDMVGAGNAKLLIDAGGIVADQSLVAAAQLGIEVETQSMGRSDHAPFVGAGVPATLYIWWDGVAPGVIYHVPEDNLDNIEPDKLQAAGQLAHLVLLQFSHEQEKLEDLFVQYEQAIAARDADALHAITYDQDRELLLWQEDWLKGLTLRQPAEFSATVGSALVATDIATATVTLRYRWKPEHSQAMASFPAKWVRDDHHWYYGGPAWDAVQGQHTLVQHFQQPDLAQSIAQEADSLYEFLVDEADLDLPDPIVVGFYSQPFRSGDLALPGTGSKYLLHALHAPPPGYDEAPGWPLSDGIALSDQASLPTLLFEFALQHTGWPTQTTSWLAQGLSDCRRAMSPMLEEQLQSEYIPLLLQANRSGTLWTAQEMPTRYQISPPEGRLWVAQSWAMAHYLLQTHGWTALRYPTAINMESWRTALLAPWQLAAEGIEQTLAERRNAILARDQAAFLATVDPQNTTLYQEETHWFEDLLEHPVAEFAYESQLLSLTDHQATIRLTAKYKLAEPDASSMSVTYNAHFVHKDNRWLYADVAFMEQRSEHFVLKYQHPDQGRYATTLLDEAERAYDLVTADLDFYPIQPIEIKAYDDNSTFRYSIYLSMPYAQGWTEPGESIKLGIPDWRQNGYNGVGRIIAHELTHTALFAKGVQHGGVHEGAAQYEATRYDPQWFNQEVRKWRRQVYDLVRSKRPLTLADLDNWRELSKDDLQLLYSVGWDIVSYFRQCYGRETFLEWLRLLGTGLSFGDAFVRTTGTTFADFDAAWRESVLRGHISPQLIALSSEFDGELALQHVYTLTQAAWTGREAGTLGNDAAAHYIAEQFAALGLQPAGDNGTYFQTFAFTQTALITTPQLTLIGQDGQTHTLQYRVDFRELLGGCAGGGQAGSSIVYVKDLKNENIQLGGRVALARAGPDPWTDAENALSRGAGGLLLITDKWPKDMSIKTDDIHSLSTPTIPVFELTREAFDLLLTIAGYRSAQLEKSPPALPLPLSVRMSVQIESALSSASNVLGVLLGSDPELADEVLILGAHLDHVGILPDGTLYPGANNDASGVAVLLELARLWHEAGYYPRRTVLFAAWNAAEQGLLGSRYYVAHPVYPLTSTVAAIQLDMVGQGRGYYIGVYAEEQQDAIILAHLDNAATQVEGRLNFSKYEGNSDHETFHALGIPAVKLSWERPDYVHMPGDTPDLIDTRKLQATGRVLALTIMTLADHE